MGERVQVRKIGRKKRKRFTRIAIQIECTDEFCWRCKKLVKKRDSERKVMLLYCMFFRKLLSPALGESVAERCSDCHMAQRCADGEIMW